MRSHDVLAMLDSGYHEVVQYEFLPLRNEAKCAIPLEKLQCAAAAKVVQEGKLYCASSSARSFPEGEEHELTFLQDLADWFKRDFFSWVNSPNCEACGSSSRMKSMRRSVYDRPIPSFSGRGKVPYVIDIEEHECISCRHITDFPRHTDAAILLSTRKGRCSEWAQVFTLMCRSLGYRARLVLDVTDHVWTEVFSFSRGRWMCIDSCEASVDQPLLYERGWGKSLTYIVAIGADDVQDVSWRYSADHARMRSRRDPSVDRMLLQAIDNKRKELFRHKSPKLQKILLRRVLLELIELMEPPVATGEYGGRTSGDKEWILSRAEGGDHSATSEVIRFARYLGSARSSTFGIEYSSALDQYLVKWDGGSTSLSKWSSLVFNHHNIQRKVERDWEMSYLARRTASSDGTIEWQFDAGESHITAVRIDAAVFVKQRASVSWHLEDNEKSPIAKVTNVDPITLTLLTPVTHLTIRVHLASPPANQEIAWQHAQLFRTSTRSTLNQEALGFCFSLSHPQK